MTGSGPPRRRIGGKALVGLLTVALLLGCQSMDPYVDPFVQLDFGLDSQAEKEMASLLRWYSGRVEVYKGFETVFTARAVYLSDEVVEALTEWESETRLLEEKDRQELLDRLKGSNPEQMTFLIEFYTPDDDRERLEEPDSLYSLALRLADGGSVRSSCLDVGQEREEEYIGLLRWDLTWSRLYYVCFPAPLQEVDPDGEGVTLIISGPGGAGEIRMRTRPRDSG